MHTESTATDPRQDIPTLLRTIGRAVIQGYGIPTFGQLIDNEPGEATDLIIAALGDRTATTIKDLEHDILAYGEAGNINEMHHALIRIQDELLTRQTNHCEAYYLIGVFVTLRAVAKARSLANLDIQAVITELVTRESEEGRDRGQ